jgi:hypothetical protein
LARNVEDGRGQTSRGSGEEGNRELMHIDCTAGQKAIFGHFFGDLCVLHALFSKQGDAHDAYFVASLSVWRDLKMIEKAEEFCRCEEIGWSALYDYALNG